MERHAHDDNLVLDNLLTEDAVGNVWADVCHIGVIVLCQLYLRELQLESRFVGTFCRGLRFFVGAVDVNLRELQGSLYAECLVLLGGALYVLVLTFAQIDAQHQLLSLAEVLGDVVDEQIALAAEAVAHIGGADGCAVPRLGEIGVDDAAPAESIGANAEEALGQRALRDAESVSIVASLFTIHHVKLAVLSHIARRLTIVHLVDDVGFHQAEALLVAGCFEAGHGGMHDGCGTDIVHVPRIRHPTAGGQRGELGRHWDVRYGTVHVFRSLVGLLRTAGIVFYRCADGP